jgi:hypothetical protein
MCRRPNEVELVRPNPTLAPGASDGLHPQAEEGPIAVKGCRKGLAPTSSEVGKAWHQQIWVPNALRITGLASPNGFGLGCLGPAVECRFRLLLPNRYGP